MKRRDRATTFVTMVVTPWAGDRRAYARDSQAVLAEFRNEDGDPIHYSGGVEIGVDGVPPSWWRRLLGRTGRQSTYGFATVRFGEPAEIRSHLSGGGVWTAPLRGRDTLCVLSAVEVEDDWLFPRPPRIVAEGTPFRMPHPRKRGQFGPGMLTRFSDTHEIAANSYDVFLGTFDVPSFWRESLS